MQAFQQPGVAREVHRHAGLASNLADIVIGEDFVIQPAVLDEPDIARRSQADTTDIGRAVLGDARQPHRGLGRCAGEDCLARAEPAFRTHEILDQEARLEQRSEDHPFSLARGIVFGIGCEARVAVVDRAHRLPVFGHVGEPRGADLAGDHVEMGCHGQIAVDAFVHRDLGMVALDHPRMAPHGNDAPTIGRGEEVPVAEAVTDHGIGHIVRSDRKTLDRKPHCARGQWPLRGFNQFGLADGILADVDLLHSKSSLCGEDASGRCAAMRALRRASASEHKAQANSRPCGSAWARPHPRDGSPPCRHRSG